MSLEVANWMKKMGMTVERRIAIRKRLRLACEILKTAEEVAVEFELDRLAEQTIYQMRQVIETRVKEIQRQQTLNEDQLKAVNILQELYHRYGF